MKYSVQQTKAIQNAACFINHHEIDESDAANFLDSIENDGFYLVPKELMDQVVETRQNQIKYENIKFDEEGTPKANDLYYNKKVLTATLDQMLVDWNESQHLNEKGGQS